MINYINSCNQIQLRESAYIPIVHADNLRTDKCLEKNLNYRVENAIRQFVHASAVRSSTCEALGKFGEHSRS